MPDLSENRLERESGHLTDHNILADVVNELRDSTDAKRLTEASDTRLDCKDNFAVNTAGRGFLVKEGSNAKMGVSTLVAGTIAVANTSVTATSRIFLTCQTPGGTPGFLRISARVAGTSFTILSSSNTDTSVVAWLILEPA